MRRAWLVAMFALGVGCTGDDRDVVLWADAGSSETLDGQVQPPADVGSPDEGRPDARPDQSLDGAPRPPDAVVDASPEAVDASGDRLIDAARPDQAVDAEADLGVDAEADAGEPDAARDAAPEPDAAPDSAPDAAPCEVGAPCKTNLLGECGNGTTVCGPEGARCDAPPGVELCSGLDEDCDGEVDEDFDLGGPCPTGRGACQVVGEWVCGEDLEALCVGEIGPPSPEICDRIDNDCDGRFDESEEGGALSQPCYSGREGTRDVGPCAAGVSTCARGEWGACEGQVLPAAETCNGIDDDCDHLVDDDDGAQITQLCYDAGLALIGRGICQAGARHCVDGLLGGCREQVLPGVEVCDGQDNDCDLEVDEVAGGCACLLGEARDCYDAAPETEGEGPCRAGRQTCEGRSWGRCDGAVRPAAEACNQIDDDCDGETDEGLGVGVACSRGVGECAAEGLRGCDAEGEVACLAELGAPAAEQCNGLDDDCDGATDEAFPVGDACGVGIGACARQGRLACVEGEVTCDSLPGEPAAERCNAIDDDCDGTIDEGFGLGEVCLRGAGECEAEGVRRCDGSGAARCDARPSDPEPETCDGRDEDCDGETDEGFDLGAVCSVGLGICLNQGIQRCTPEGQAACSAEAGAAEPETCNGEDDDCDGKEDEGLEDLGPCDSGNLGACRPGRFVCIGRARHCARTIDPAPEACNGLDDDCDGVADEDIGVVVCGQGVCERRLPACVGGAPVACEPFVGAAEGEVCDGLDEDCDGRVDEDALDVGEACGVGQGVCRRLGEARCEDSQLVCSAEPADPSPETCDGEDEDCDGRVDEALAEQACARGVGACARAGVETCEAGELRCDAQPGEAIAELCNQRDDDCDGITDEGLGGQVCGLGQCRRELAACAGGEIPDCDPLAGAEAETCDGIDNDCDGEVDEAPEDAGGACDAGRGRCRAEGVEACVDGELVCDAVAGAPQDERCNNLDDDCDGTTDEATVDTGGSCAAGIGACRRGGLLVCVDGLRGCNAEAGRPGPEACNGVDDDCDGVPDEALGNQVCGQGLCRRDLPVCVEGAAVACEPNEGALEETCNGVDDDCDGTTDEGQGGEACEGGVGECASVGLTRCLGGELGCDRVHGVPRPEACDGLDQDCDGRADEDFALGTQCRTGTGACRRDGVRECGEGGVVCVAPPPEPGAETCDGVDEDCDGRVDEGLDDLGPCQTGEPGACGVGRATCRGGASDCRATVFPTWERCDGVDRDCDGEVDEGLGVDLCGQGLCAREIPVCVEGAPSVCEPRAGAVPETCDGEDEDCDGSIDEDTDGAPCTDGIGVCARVGVERCEAGGLSCTAEAGAPAEELCNGLDDDCDGLNDEGVELGRCATGVGACRREADRVCESGAAACPAEAGEPGVEICNGEDDDCDGSLDEGFGSVVCGVGACRHAVPHCAGGEAPECDPLAGAGPDVCNGEDDDCDGEIDEGDFGLGQVCHAGIGACRSVGGTACIEGLIGCDAEPSEPGAERCNGVDDDCDGVVDEDALEVGAPCSAGAGACQVAGAQLCQEGRVSCDAVPAEPGAEACNGEDEDCDGAIDEGLGIQRCGEGVCERILAACAEGSPVPCEPLLGAGEEQCNGADDDCDGEVDEGLPDLSCGEGVCARDLPRCVDGRLNACDPFLGAGEETCDGRDEDCDGAVDEDLDLGRCRLGVGSCVVEAPRVCLAGEPVCPVEPGEPSAEVCNGLDDDCDERADEEIAERVCGVGVCEHVLSGCTFGNVPECDPLLGAGSETCDGRDEDCDGVVDEEVDPGTCSAGIGACRQVVEQRCEGGQIICDAAALPPGVEICNAIDDDCDARIDESPSCVPDERPPVVQLVADAPDVVDPGTPVGLQVIAFDDRGVVEWSLSQDGEELELDGQGLANTVLESPGLVLFRAEARDAAGNLGWAEIQIRVRDPEDGLAPDLEIHAPEAGAEVAAPTVVVASSFDDDPWRWWLFQGAPAEPYEIELAGGTGDLDAAEIGALDPFGLPPGEYVLTLRAEDASGNRSEVSQPFFVVACTPTEERCNGRDEDCDGEVDETFELGLVCSAGVGGCEAEGLTVCAADGLAMSCDAPLGRPGPETCDGTDEDCDGEVDEGCPADIPLQPIPVEDAVRFLGLAAFGGTDEEIEALAAVGYEKWIDNQLRMPLDEGFHLRRTIEIAEQAQPSVDFYDEAGTFNTESHYLMQAYQSAAWWEKTLHAPDQLRQRVAFALSEILVVSTGELPLDRRTEALAVYYDILSAHAFGSYRALVEAIALNPAMGVYLSHQGNRKRNDIKRTLPDENFARELMQLFTIGLYRRGPDGTRLRDLQDRLIPAYTQTDVEELSRVFTGWDLRRNGDNSDRRFGDSRGSVGDYTQPMEFVGVYHDVGPKAFLGAIIPGALSGLDDVRAALDILFAQSSLAPRLSLRLIQRLVTSNPSAGYVEHVSDVFTQTEGDLGAVTRAIFLHPEATDPLLRSEPGYGKGREPIVAFAGLLRLLDVRPLGPWSSLEEAPMGGVYWFRSARIGGQAPLRSPSVFNFFDAEYVPPSEWFVERDLVAPEFEVQTEWALMEYSNLLYGLSGDSNTFERNAIVASGVSLDEFAAGRDYGSSILYLVDGSEELALMERVLEGDANGDFVHMRVPERKARAVAALIDHLDVMLLGGTLPDEARLALETHLVENLDHADPQRLAFLLFGEAIRFLASSTHYMVQK